MTLLLKSGALALAMSFAMGGAALACGPDGCGKDKDGKMECCCDKMKDDKAAPKAGAEKPAPPSAEHKDHQH